MSNNLAGDQVSAQKINNSSSQNMMNTIARMVTNDLKMHVQTKQTPSDSQKVARFYGTLEYSLGFHIVSMKFKQILTHRTWCHTTAITGIMQ